MFYLNLEIESLLSIGDSLKPVVEKAMKDAAQKLTMATHGHILEEVQSKLKSTRQKYIDALSFEEVGDNAWIISLDPSAFFIEEGMPQHEMIDDLLKQGRPNKSKSEGSARGGIKTAKDGSRYRAIPFQQNKTPTSQTPMQTSLTGMVKAEMKARGISYGKIEKNSNGEAKTGLLHSFDVVSRGKGAQPVPVSRVGIPLLQGVRVYQSKVKDKAGKEVTKKGIFTFRMVSSKMRGSGRWVHPGIAAKKFMDDAFGWAIHHWETVIAPSVVDEVMGSL